MHVLLQHWLTPIWFVRKTVHCTEVISFASNIRGRLVLDGTTLRRRWCIDRILLLRRRNEHHRHVHLFLDCVLNSTPKNLSPGFRIRTSLFLLVHLMIDQPQNIYTLTDRVGLDTHIAVKAILWVIQQTSFHTVTCSNLNYSSQHVILTVHSSRSVLDSTVEYITGFITLRLWWANFRQSEAREYLLLASYLDSTHNAIQTIGWSSLTRLDSPKATPIEPPLRRQFHHIISYQPRLHLFPKNCRG